MLKETKCQWYNLCTINDFLKKEEEVLLCHTICGAFKSWWKDYKVNTHEHHDKGPICSPEGR